MTSSDEKIFLFFTGLFAIAATAFTNCMLWHWFVVPKFPHAPEFTLLQMLGLTVTVRSLALKTSYEKDQRPFMERALWEILYPTFGLGMGWVLHLLVVRFS